jgi:RimJ/RimL family protein N-acetyltransferase
MLIAFEDDASALETGWHLQPAAWGHGYAQEALNAILAHGFSIPGIARIVAFIHRDNLRSQKLAARLGLMPTTIQSGLHGLYEKFSGAPEQGHTSSFSGS